ncbi:RNA-directed DNA polymerase, eukaryota, reverse transcriptase zinc-binding domain protein [Tanacetum coccineum]
MLRSSILIDLLKPEKEKGFFAFVRLVRQVPHGFPLGCRVPQKASNVEDRTNNSGPDMPLTYQLLRNSGGDSRPDLSFDKVIKAIYGEDEKIGSGSKVGYKSIWRVIVQEMEVFKAQGIDLYSFMQKKLGNGADTFFWDDVWRGDMALKQRYPRLYALELNKKIDVASKLTQESLISSFRRVPRSGVEQSQLIDLMAYIEGVVLGVSPDRWSWALEGSGEFSVASVKKVIDDNRLPDVSTQTRWIKAVPIKVNVHAWKVRLDCSPTRLNISGRGIDIPSILCPICGRVTESSRHLFFDCHIAKDNFHKICHWWNVDFMEVSSFDEWSYWIVNLRMPKA